MQDVIRKMIEIDKMAQTKADEAIRLRDEAEASIKEDKKKLRAEYIEKARARIQVNAGKEECFLQEALANIQKRNEAEEAKMRGAYEQNGKHWVDEIFSRVTGR